MTRLHEIIYFKLRIHYNDLLTEFMNKYISKNTMKHSTIGIIKIKKGKKKNQTYRVKPLHIS
jgi:hypothetical protein